MRNKFILGRFVIALVLTVVPAQAALAPGTLVKGSLDAVYYYARDGRRYVFPNVQIFRTWYPDFRDVVRIPDAELALFPIGGNVTSRPGVRMLKLPTDPKVYAVDANGTLRWITTESVAAALYGADWRLRVDDLPEAFFVNYRLGLPIDKLGDFSPAAATTAAPDIATDRGLVPAAPAPEPAPEPMTPEEPAPLPPPAVPPPTPFTVSLADDSPSGFSSPASEQTIAKFLFSGNGATLKLLNVDIGSTISNAAARTIRFYKDALGSGNLIGTASTCAPPAASCNFGLTALTDTDFTNIDVGSASRLVLVTADTQEARSGQTLTASIPLGGIRWTDGVTSVISIVDALPVAGRTLRF